MVPTWLHQLSIAFIALGFACAAIIAIHEFHHPQKMAIMNIVWPVTALYASVFAVWGYFAYGTREEAPFAVMTAKASTHCGAGCTVGDICAEWLAFAFPVTTLALGYGTLFPDRIFAVWVLDFILAFLFGIVFQYFTIAPMRNLGVGEGIWQAVKADTLSITAWQAGMYGFMAFANFYIFRHLLGAPLETDSFEFWFMMQIAMICGFFTSYPMNWWLLRIGVKEKM